MKTLVRRAFSVLLLYWIIGLFVFVQPIEAEVTRVISNDNASIRVFRHSYNSLPGGWADYGFSDGGWAIPERVWQEDSYWINTGIVPNGEWITGSGWRFMEEDDDVPNAPRVIQFTSDETRPSLEQNFFRQRFSIPSTHIITKAYLYIASDNNAHAWINNNRVIGNSNTWSDGGCPVTSYGSTEGGIHTRDVTSAVVPGNNIIAFNLLNTAVCGASHGMGIQWMLYIEHSPGCTIQGVTRWENSSPIAGYGDISVDGVWRTNTNPYSIRVVGDQWYTVSIDVPPGYSVASTACANSISCHSPVNSSNWAYQAGSTKSIYCYANGYADLWWHYFAPPTPTPTPTRTPTPTPTPCPLMTAPTNLLPSGTIMWGTRNITWNAVSGAQSYALRVDDLSTQWSGTCSWTYGGDLCTSMTGRSYSYNFIAGRSYDIWVHSYSSCRGYSPERRVRVTVLTPTPTPTPTPTRTPTPTPTPCPLMTAPTNLQPSGTIMWGTRNIAWDAVPGAQSYELRVDDLSTQWSGTCSWRYGGDVCLSQTTRSYSYNFQAGRTYDIWVHSYSSCHGFSPARRVRVTVLSPTPTPTRTPTPTPTRTPTPTPTRTPTPTPSLNPYLVRAQPYCGPTGTLTNTTTPHQLVVYDSSIAGSYTSSPQTGSTQHSLSLPRYYNPPVTRTYSLYLRYGATLLENMTIRTPLSHTGMNFISSGGQTIGAIWPLRNVPAGTYSFMFNAPDAWCSCSQNYKHVTQRKVCSGGIPSEVTTPRYRIDGSTWITESPSPYTHNFNIVWSGQGNITTFQLLGSGGDPLTPTATSISTATAAGLIYDSSDKSFDWFLCSPESEVEIDYLVTCEASSITPEP